MHAETVVALASAGIAAVIAVAVPFMTFRLALRQDQARWLREQRSQLYVDLLTEAYAERRYLEHVMSPPEIQEQARQIFTEGDVRSGPVERGRLGARGTIFGSQTVNRLFNQIGAIGGQATFGPRTDEAQMRVRILVGEAFDQLEAAVRRELGADRIAIHGSAGQPQNERPPAGTTG